MARTVSIIIPTLNEETTIETTLTSARAVRGVAEVIVVDGGSADATEQLAAAQGATVLRAPRGRGPQMHAGACASRGDALWFLHSDTRAPVEAAERILDALADPATVGGNFGLLFDGPSRAARQLTAIYPHLRRLGLCYGDSGIFVRRSAYEAIGGFQPYPLFEDLDLIRRLRQAGRFVHLPQELVTSSRRFEHRSFPLMFAQWTAMQVLYWLGVPPATLSRAYAPIRGRRPGPRADKIAAS